MANRKTLPRELKMKETIQSLEEKNTELLEELRQLYHIRDRMENELDKVYRLLGEAKEHISDLEDFKKFARYALPHLQEKRQLLAVNTGSKAEKQEH